MTNRQSPQPSDESSRDKEAREDGSAAGDPAEVRRRAAEGGGIEKRLRAAIARAESELRDKPTGVE